MKNPFQETGTAPRSPGGLKNKKTVAPPEESEDYLEKVDAADITEFFTPEAKAREERRLRELVSQASIITDAIIQRSARLWLDGDEAREEAEYRQVVQQLEHGNLEAIQDERLGGTFGTQKVKVTGAQHLYAYKKHQHDEIYYAINDVDQRPVLRVRERETVIERDESGQYKLRSEPVIVYKGFEEHKLSEAEKKHIDKVKSNLDIAKDDDWLESIAKRYKLTKQQVRPLLELSGFRIGTVERMYAREFGCAALSELLGIRKIPPTVIRADAEGPYSLQAEFRDSEVLSSEKSEDALAEVIRALLKEEDHEGIDEMMDIAVLHYVFQVSDGHSKNGLKNKTGYASIDHGLSFGYSFQSKKGSIPFNPLVSVPLQLISLNPHVRISEKTRTRLETFYHEVQSYLAYIHAAHSLDHDKLAAISPLPEKVKQGETAKIMQKIFRLMFDVPGQTEVTNKIMTVEMDAFLNRIKFILDHGRPPLFDLPQEVKKEKEQSEEQEKPLSHFKSKESPEILVQDRFISRLIEEVKPSILPKKKQALTK